MSAEAKRSKDPLLSATSLHLWPDLKAAGFHKLTPRVFVREAEGIVHRITIDANGAAGKASTHLIYDARQLAYPDLTGYLVGDRMKGGPWNMATPEAADASMQDVATRIRSAVLPWFSAHANLAAMGVALDRKIHEPREPLDFERAANKAALGDLTGARTDLQRAMRGALPYWSKADGPSGMLMNAINDASHRRLLDDWAAARRLKFGLTKGPTCP